MANLADHRILVDVLRGAAIRPLVVRVPKSSELVAQIVGAGRWPGGDRGRKPRADGTFSNTLYELRALGL